MQEPTLPTAPLEWKHARDEMGARLRPPFAAPSSGKQFHRIEILLQDIDPLEWLGAQRECTQYYWSDREAGFTMGGVGEADILQPAEELIELAQLFQTMRSRLVPEYPSLRYYGGFRFSTSPRPHSLWRKFKAYRFVVPLFEVLRRGPNTWFACNLLLSPDADSNARRAEEARALLVRLTNSPAPSVPPPAVLLREDSPDKDAWCALVEEAIDAFARRELEKVVLARETRFTMKAFLDPVALLSQLVLNSPNSFEFCFHPVLGRAFIGASPERLFKRHNVWLQSEALAGTRPRGRNDADDARFARELLNNDKELREHRLVLHTLRGHFQRFCTAFREEDAPSLMLLRHCQHLYTRIEGILKDTNLDGALIEALHPTPAVGGTPRNRALDWLDNHEPFDRGIYAAPVGWVNYDGCEFCVAIRSGLIRDNLLAVYTGAGIVPGSVPEEEWMEIENKMAGFLEILTASSE